MLETNKQTKCPQLQSKALSPMILHTNKLLRNCIIFVQKTTWNKCGEIHVHPNEVLFS